MYIPHAKEVMETLLGYAHQYYAPLDSLSKELGYGRKPDEARAYSFQCYAGNVKAIFDMLTFIDYNPEKLDYSSISPEYPLSLIKTSKMDEMEFYVEVRHPEFKRPKYMLWMQERLNDQSYKYFMVDSFPDFWEQYLQMLYHK